jgi:NitT/TauT family transport system ATP-binding protein
VTHDVAEAAYLQDRVIVLARSPGTIAASIEVGRPRPRTRTETRSYERLLAVRNEVHDVIAGARQ